MAVVYGEGECEEVRLQVRQSCSLPTVTGLLQVQEDAECGCGCGQLVCPSGASLDTETCACTCRDNVCTGRYYPRLETGCAGNGLWTRPAVQPH